MTDEQKDKERARQDRMRSELETLDGNVQRLGGFIDGPGYNDLNVDEQSALNEQLSGMKQYQGALRRRVGWLQPVED